MRPPSWPRSLCEGQPEKRSAQSVAGRRLQQSVHVHKPSLLILTLFVVLGSQVPHWPCDRWASLCHPLPRALSGAGTAKGCSVVTSHGSELRGAQTKTTQPFLEKRVMGRHVLEAPGARPRVGWTRKGSTRVILVCFSAPLGQGLAPSHPQTPLLSCCSGGDWHSRSEYLRVPDD